MTQRIVAISACIAAALMLLVGRLVYIQIICGDRIQARQERQATLLQKRLPMRGDIMDAKGVKLATSVPAVTIAADPTLLVGRHEYAARLLAPILMVDEAALAKRLEITIRPGFRTNNGVAQRVWLTNQYVLLQRKVSMDRWQQVTQAMASLPFLVSPESLPRTNRIGRIAQTNFWNAARTRSIQSTPDQIRTYPGQTLAAQIIGSTGQDELASGVLGLEAKFDELLQGQAGWMISERDAKRHEISQFRRQDVEARSGNSLVLTIDAWVQYHLETAMAGQMKELGAKGMMGLVMRPKTGDILAMASLPTFDPANIRPGDSNFFNSRLVTDQYEPGSTFKVVTVAAALDAGLVRMDDKIFCENGSWHYHGRARPLRDSTAHGWLTVDEIIAKSSNIGAGKIGEKMGGVLMCDYIEAFGFGKRTDLPMPAESYGLVHRPDRTNYFPSGRVIPGWNGLSVAQIPMGQGIAVTPLQMSMAVAAIANRGVLMKPRLIDRILDADGNQLSRTPVMSVRRVLREETANAIIESLKGPVAAGGTATRARMENYSVAGKTGTAQKPELGGYSETKFYASFIGFFPASDPEVLIAIIVDEPEYDRVHKNHQGGRAAAPVFAQIGTNVANYLNIRPDILKTNAATASILAAGTP